MDRVVVRDGIAHRLADSFETALALADGVVYAENADGGERTVFSSRFACPVSGFSIEEIEPRLFSFNSPHGACPACDGLGVESVLRPPPGGAGRAGQPRRRRGRALGERAQPVLRPDPAKPGQAFPGFHPHAPGATCRRGCATPSFSAPARSRWRWPTRTGCAQYTVTKPVRGGRPQPATPLRGDRQRLGARGNEPLPGGKALRGLPRRAAEAGSAGGEGGGQHHRRGERAFHPRARSSGSPACCRR